MGYDTPERLNKCKGCRFLQGMYCSNPDIEYTWGLPRLSIESKVHVHINDITYCKISPEKHGGQIKLF